MGLTIQYLLAAQARKASQVRELLGALRDEALKLPFAKTSEMAHFVGPEAEHRRNPDEDWRWFLIQAQGHVRDPRQPDFEYRVPPLEVFGFQAWSGEGCEPMNVGLCL